MPQGNCVEHINLNKTLYRAAECPHCKIILLEGLLREEQEDCQKQRSSHNDMVRRVMKLEIENERLNKALSEGIPILEQAADRIEKLEAALKQIAEPTLNSKSVLHEIAKEALEI